MHLVSKGFWTCTSTHNFLCIAVLWAGKIECLIFGILQLLRLIVFCICNMFLWFYVIRRRLCSQWQIFSDTYEYQILTVLSSNFYFDIYFWTDCNDRWSRAEVFCKQGFLRNFEKFTGKHLRQSIWHRYFPVNFVKFYDHLFYRTPLVAAPVMISTISFIISDNFGSH